MSRVSWDLGAALREIRDHDGHRLIDWSHCDLARYAAEHCRELAEQRTMRPKSAAQRERAGKERTP